MHLVFILLWINVVGSGVLFLGAIAALLIAYYE